VVVRYTFSIHMERVWLLIVSKQGAKGDKGDNGSPVSVLITRGEFTER
jgi:hypothetical protein